MALNPRKNTKGEQPDARSMSQKRQAQRTKPASHRGKEIGAKARTKKGLKQAPTFERRRWRNGATNSESYACDLSNALIQFGRDEEAIVISRRAVQQGPNFTPAHRYLIAALANAGQLAGAQGILKNLLKIEPDASLRGFNARNVGTAMKRIADGLRKAGFPE